MVPYEVAVEGGIAQIILVEVSTRDDAFGGPMLAPVEVSNDPAAASHTFQDALQRVKPALAAVGQVLREVNNPREISVEFGLKFTGTMGVVLASTGSEVTFKVALKWVNEPQTPPSSLAAPHL